MVESEELCSSSWRFGMELLSNVHTLRVFLFNSSPHVKPHQDCECLKAALLSAPPILSCTWKFAHQPSLCSLCLPLPLLLFDYSAAPRISALPDCVELSLPLLPLPPFHLNAFSALSLADDSIVTQGNDRPAISGRKSPGILGVHREAFIADSGVHRENGNFHSGDGVKSYIHDDTQETGHAATDNCNVRGSCHHDGRGNYDPNPGKIDGNISKNPLQVAADVGHSLDKAHQSYEYGLGSLVNNGSHEDGDESLHENHGHNGIPEVGLCEIPASNTYSRNRDSAQQDELAGNSILAVQHACNNFFGLGQRVHYQANDIEAHGSHEIQRDAGTALNVPGCHNYAVREFHGNEFGVCANDEPFKSHQQSDAEEIGHIASPTLDIFGCHHNGIINDGMKADRDMNEVCVHAVDAEEDVSSRYPCSHASFPCSEHHSHDFKAFKGSTQLIDCPSLHDSNVVSEASLQCQHDRNMTDVPKIGSFLQSRYPDSMALEISTHQGHEDQVSQRAAIFHCKKCLVKISKNPIRNVVQLPCFDWRDVVENWFGACCCSFGSKAEILSASFERSLKLRPGKCLVGPSTVYVDFTDVTVETQPVVLNTDSIIREWSTLRFLALGNGFMVWESQPSRYFSWQPVYCSGCSALIGAYACKVADSGLVREGLHLFLCQIMVSNANGTLNDTCRYDAFKELLAKELRLRTEENTSYRFLIRSLNSQRPLLQLVVLSYDALISTGKVTAYEFDLGVHPQNMRDATRSPGESGLQQSMKVLFCDCSGFSENEVRSTERWVQDYDVETVYMLDELIDILKRELLSNMKFYPAASGLPQAFHSSFIHTSKD